MTKDPAPFLVPGPLPFVALPVTLERVTPEQYSQLDPLARARWITYVGPQSAEEEELIAGEQHHFVRAEAAGSVTSPALLQRLYDDEPDPGVRVVIATNRHAPLALIGSVPVYRQTGASLVAYLDGRGFEGDERELIGEALNAHSKDGRPLEVFVAAVLAGP
ncbi:hypothetical protein [Cellulomonas sp. URHD0024]|uniref:hypothetical protein n=1 Tax=Cellulomonas sp. URHD0024 TaxID=1302620 RepID=UPI0018CB99DF|nr:hypothetical protein [Cellulomonas sp. URHD0024]